MSDQENKKKTITDEAFDIISDHPIATTAVLSIGLIYVSAKFQQYMTYKAVLKANIDAYKTIMDLK